MCVYTVGYNILVVCASVFVCVGIITVFECCVAIVVAWLMRSDSRREAAVPGHHRQ